MKSIRTRLLVLLLAGIALTLAGGGIAVYWIARAGMLEQLDASLNARAHTIASLVAFEPGRPAFESGALVFDSGDAPADVLTTTWFELRDSTGAVLKRSTNLGVAELPRRDPGPDDIVIEDLVLPEEVQGRAIWHSFRPRIDEDLRPTPTGFETELLVVVAAIDRGPLDAALDTLLTTLFVVGGGIGVVTCLLVILGVRTGLAPLDRLGRQLGEIGGRTLSNRLDGSNAPRELTPIYREINEMLDRVERTLERERSFADATAHELRTPLAELRATAEVALRWPEPGRALDALHEILTIGHEMERLVESLLLISRGHASEGDQADTDVDLAPIVARVMEHESSTIEAKRIGVIVDLNGGASMHAPREAIEIIIRNLITNAVHYTPRGGRLAVRGDGSNGHAAYLDVENDPVELREEDLALLFRPFWRADGSRADRTHAGLGLAVVKQVAHATGLEVTAALHGKRLTIRLARGREASGPNGSDR